MCEYEAEVLGQSVLNRCACDPTALLWDLATNDSARDRDILVVNGNTPVDKSKSDTSDRSHGLFRTQSSYLVVTDGKY